MSESKQHQQLVELIYKKVIEIVGQDHKTLIATDAVDGLTLPPFTTEGFRPDVFYCYENLLVIGEAKISDDIEKFHSKQQYESYIRKCSLFHGNAVLIVAVPWLDHAVIFNIITRIRKKYPGDYSVIILDGIGGAI